MEYLHKINQEKLNIISNFNEQELMVLLDSLIKKYYSAYVYGDVDKCKSLISFIEDVIFMFEDDMEYLPQYINFRMLQHANSILKSVFKHDFDYAGYEVAIESINPAYSLSASIRNSFKVKIDKVDKVNIKNLHDMVANGDISDSNVAVLVNALYDSFLAKEDDDCAECGGDGLE